MVNIEQAEARLDRIVDVTALFYGVIIGAIVSFLVQLAIPVKIIMNQTGTEISVAWNTFGPMKTQDYYVLLLSVSLFVVAPIAVWRVRKVYGLTDRIEEKFEHQDNKTQLAESLDSPLEILGKTYGYRMKRDLDQVCEEKRIVGRP